MSRGVRFDSLLQAVHAAWMNACEASALRHQAAREAWEAESGDGTTPPRRAIFRAPLTPAGHLEPLEIGWAELFPRRWMRPACLSLTFDCEIRQRPDRSWYLHIVEPGKRPWGFARTRHRVEIVADGQDVDGGEVRFDGLVWREFGARAKTERHEPAR